MSKHTPGPWRVERSNDGEHWTRGAWDLVSGDGVYRVVLASRAPWTSRAEESEANARLIAAAPELLAALKGLLRDHDEYCDHGTFPSADVARAAIAKAEGR